MRGGPSWFSVVEPILVCMMGPPVANEGVCVGSQKQLVQTLCCLSQTYNVNELRGSPCCLSLSYSRDVKRGRQRVPFPPFGSHVYPYHISSAVETGRAGGTRMNIHEKLHRALDDLATHHNLPRRFVARVKKKLVSVPPAVLERSMSAGASWSPGEASRGEKIAAIKFDGEPVTEVEDIERHLQGLLRETLLDEESRSGGGPRARGTRMKKPFKQGDLLGHMASRSSANVPQLLLEKTFFTTSEAGGGTTEVRAENFVEQEAASRRNVQEEEADENLLIMRRKRKVGSYGAAVSDYPYTPEGKSV